MSFPRTPPPARGSDEVNGQQNPNQQDLIQNEDQIIMVPQDQASIAAIRDMRLPPFIKTRPDVWFQLIESRFRTYRITSDLTKYDLTLGQLDSETLHQITDIICQQPEKDKYLHLKNAMLARLSESREKQLSTLLNNLELGNKKPSELLREMKTLAGETVSDEFLYSLWINRMPVNVRSIVSVADRSNLNNVAQLADKILSYATNSNIMAVSSPANDLVAIENSATLQTLVNLEKKVENLQKMMQNLQSQLKQRSRSSSKGRSEKTGGKSPINRSMCYYHARFGASANKCTSPCSFILPQQGN
ncbi:uncharacterized protein [Prorops nasuta]|uniref:uncharacterized protein n=1 Tax=Prorops nasuta TaxID=863751 RepID=UPI0034CFEBAA